MVYIFKVFIEQLLSDTTLGSEDIQANKNTESLYSYKQKKQKELKASTGDRVSLKYDDSVENTSAVTTKARKC